MELSNATRDAVEGQGQAQGQNNDPSSNNGLRRAHTVAQTGGSQAQHGLQHRAAGRLRASSLRRANQQHQSSHHHHHRRNHNKSNDLDRQPESPQEASASTGSPTADTTAGGSRSDAREGRYFTVGNVGHNGKMYLRPTPNRPQAGGNQSRGGGFSQPQSANLSPESSAPVERGGRYSMWSSSQLTDVRPTPIREDSSESKMSLYRGSPAPDEHDKRRHSYSDIDGRLPSAASNTHPEPKIVVDKGSDAGSRSESPVPAPSLEIPIPHYRLGGFRVTPEGDAELRSSANTRGSLSENPRRSSLMKVDPAIMLRRRSNDQSSPAVGASFVLPMFPVSRSLSGFTAAPTQSSVFYKLKEPIEPSVFDVLSSQMHDQSVVRYLSGTNQITAATPARIVAQITSDSFMDYELVSDFFLTFRSYLSLSNLLSLLLARLQWAIDRLEDDGRIIRIRAFAALRHWILNYFVDDFVVNRDLRVQFCDRINQMYEVVKENESASDLKIVVDLKRCWNGRCSMYWDSPEALSDTHPDSQVLPGGGELTATDGTSSSQPSTSRPIGQGTMPLAAKKFGADRRSSNKPSSPAWQRAFHAHKRSGSFSDSVRDDRAPLSNTDAHGPPNLHARDYPDSIIRGNVYSPLDPYVTALDQPSPTFEAEHPDFQGPDSSTRTDDSQKGTDSAGKKNFMESIRKVLHSRQGTSQGGGSSSGMPTSPPRLRGRTSTLPSNVAVESEKHKNRRAEAHNKGSHSRRDLLAEETLLSYQNLIVTVSRNSRPSLDTTGSKSEGSQNSALPETPKMGADLMNVNATRMSQMTTGSKSIVIVDDTRMSVPMMSGALQPPAAVGPFDPSRDPECISPGTQPPNLPPSSSPLPSSEDKTETGHEQPSPSTARRSSSVPRKQSQHTIVSLSNKLRKYTSTRVSVGSREDVGATGDRTPGRGEGEGSIYRSSSFRKSLKPFGRMLRRRPGGDLRKMQHANRLSSRHSMASFASATGTVSTVASADQNSALYMHGVEKGRESEGRRNSLPFRRPYSLLQDTSERPMRPSFEAAVERFAKLPDDDEGGVEETLLKLEGRWDRKPSQSQGGRSAESRLRQVENCEDDNGTARHLGPAYDETQSSQARPTTGGAESVSYVPSESSYCSIPLLERGLGDDSMKRPTFRRDDTAETTTAPDPRAKQAQDKSVPEKDPSDPSIEVVEKTQSIGQIPRDSTMPKTPTSPRPTTGHHDSDDDDDTDPDVSEISSEISVDVLDKDRTGGDGGGVNRSPSVKLSSLGAPAHPLVHPPSAPRATQLPTLASTFPDPLHGYQPEHRDSQPLSPGSVNTAKNEPPNAERDGGPGSAAGHSQHAQDPSSSSPAPSDHVPFILAHDSRTLAQQFTVVEQAALSEVDWRDLVEMRWSHASQSTLNWVEYLAEEERRGLDIVVARFNLMVKWCISQVVLTKSIQERAAVITKLIHIAVHARKLCNYATMLQITIALSSVDCTRLVRTWEAVPDDEKRMLRDMEPLVQPVRNFHKLRMEMEDSTLQNGCIPFVGLYVQDLTYNSQKPAQIASTREGEPLVNFERYRTAATIVKSLLRLIDASTKYSFEALHGVVERCLWISALPDDKIIWLSKRLS